MNEDALVVLVHGFCRRAKHMAYWRTRLLPDYPHVFAADLPETHQNFEDCLKTLERQLAEQQAERYPRLLMVGHSMGGLLMREYLARHRPGNARRCVCVGTPHAGSRLADIAAIFPGAQWAFPPLSALKVGARQRLTTPEIPGLEIGSIVGTVNGHWPGRCFLSYASDGLVEIASARCRDAADTAYVAIRHDDMQYAPEVALLIRNFLVRGKF